MYFMVFSSSDVWSSGEGSIDNQNNSDHDFNAIRPADLCAARRVGGPDHQQRSV